MLEGRETFLKIYANLPASLRKEIIVIVDDVGPMTWEAAYVDVINETPRAKEILDKLTKLSII